LLSLFSAVSWKKVEITKKKCINCDLCHNSCPVDAIRPPYANSEQEERREGVKRLLGYMLLMPLLMVLGALLMHMSAEGLSRAHKDVRLYDMVVAYEAEDAPETIPLEVEGFYMRNGTLDELTVVKDSIVAEYRTYGTWAGALMGMVLAIALIRFSVKRRRETYEIDNAACVACGRCFEYCPQNREIGKSDIEK
jgi:ferredoxin